MAIKTPMLDLIKLKAAAVKEGRALPFPDWAKACFPNGALREIDYEAFKREHSARKERK